MAIPYSSYSNRLLHFMQMLSFDRIWTSLHFLFLQVTSTGAPQWLQTGAVAVVCPQRVHRVLRGSPQPLQTFQWSSTGLRHRGQRL
jgi:hypothetical protein